MYRRLFVFLWACLWVAGTTHTVFPGVEAQGNELRVGFSESGVFVYEENGVAKGATIEAATMVFAKMDRPVVISVHPIKRIYKLFEHGQLDIIYTVHNTELHNTELHNRQVIFNKMPLMIAKIQLYSFKVKEMPSVWDLVDTSIIMVGGYTYAGMRARLERSGNKIIVLESGSRRAALLMLKAGKANYMLGYWRSTARILRELGYSEINISPVFETPMLFHMHSKTKEAQQLLMKLDVAIIEMMRETGFSPHHLQ